MTRRRKAPVPNGSAVADGAAQEEPFAEQNSSTGKQPVVEALKSESAADKELAGEAISTYSWADGKKTVSVSVDLEGLGAVADETLSVTWGVRECLLTATAVGNPPRRRTLRLTELAGEIEAAKLERKPGEDTILLRLSKKVKKPWQQLLASSAESSSLPKVEDPADESGDPARTSSFYRSKDNTFFWPVRGWENTTIPEVDGLLAVTPSLRDAFVPVENWDEVGAISLHKAITTQLLERLRTAKRILDLGCGTGALLAIFAEVAPQATLEGLEGDRAVATAAAERLARAATYFEKAGKREAAVAAHAAARKVTCGDGFEFNADGALDGQYDILVVGYAMVQKDVPMGLWAALADGGVLALSLCDEPLQVTYGKYLSHLHFFTKCGSSAFPGLKAPFSKEHRRIEQPVHFELVRPDKEAQRREVMRRLRQSG